MNPTRFLCAPKPPNPGQLRNIFKNQYYEAAYYPTPCLEAYDIFMED